MTDVCVSVACFVTTLCMQASLLLKIMAGHYAAIAGYSADLRSLVKRCLTQSPDRRPNTGDRAFYLLLKHCSTLAIAHSQHLFILLALRVV